MVDMSGSFRVVDLYWPVRVDTAGDILAMGSSQPSRILRYRNGRVAVVVLYSKLY